ncbi:hypothetical protein ICW40_01255 [Actinotalea ferrariae]|uniref:MSCRAMM family adhesin SdrC n=1 Tax=Actinotalea ferrariae TaxID=1386098 RepID=UPI001C8C7600|nr:MSCRAMM family adhesin SdrC [Actinotalea ferrariae]MBX9243432.1 hypothetical protein [Actinotalea ferrariae]
MSAVRQGVDDERVRAEQVRAEQVRGRHRRAAPPRHRWDERRRRAALVGAAALVLTGVVVGPSVAAPPTLVLTSATSVDEPGNGASQATIGESVALAARSALPPGTVDAASAHVSLADGLTLSDEAPVVTLDGAPLPAGSAVTVETDGVRVELPTGHDTGEGQELLVRVVARVADVAAATHGTVLHPSVDVVVTPTGGSPESVTGAWSVPVVEPDVSLSVSEGSPYGYTSPGDTIFFHVNFNNEGATAHDVVAVVTLDPDLHPTGEDGPLEDGEELPAGGGVWDEATRTIIWHLETLVGSWSALALLDAEVSPGTVHVPARVGGLQQISATSLTGDVPGERTAASPAGGDRYDSTTTFSVPYATPEPAGNDLAPDVQVFPGDELTLTEHVVLPAHVTTNDVTVLDTLPDGVTYAGTDSVTCTTPGCDLEAVELAPDGQRVGWFLGDLTEPTAQARVVVVVYRAVVTDAVAIQQELWFDPRVAMNADDVLDAVPALTPPDEAFDHVARDPFYDPPWLWVSQRMPVPTAALMLRTAIDEPGNGPGDAVVGERVRVEASVGLPAGEILTAAEVRVMLPTGLERASATSTIRLDGAPLPAGWRARGVPGGIVVTFGGGHATGDGQALTIAFDARVADVPEAAAGAVLPVSLDVSIRGRGTTTAHADASVTVVAPEVHAVSGHVWWDADADGVRERTEAGLHGVEVLVTGAGGDGLLGSGDDVVVTATTGARGAWTADGLPDGPTHVAVLGDLRTGTVPTADPDGPGSPWVSELTLAGADVAGLDFGVTGTASVAGRVWVDVDGAAGAGDPGAGGVRVVVVHLGADGLPGGTDDVGVLVRTAPDGSFRAGGLPAGRYVVRVDPATFPDGTVAWTDTDGGSPELTTLVLEPGEGRTGVAFGLARTGP